MISRRHFLKLTLTASGYLIYPINIRAMNAGREPEIRILLPEAMRVLSPSSFYVQSVDKTPRISKKTWTLICDGLVNRPLTLSYRDLISRPRVRRMVSFACIGNSGGNGQIGNAWWTGCSLPDLLDELDILAEARYVKFGCHDVYSTGLDLEELMSSDALVVYEMNDKPLTRAHGFPVRIVIPGRYGMKNAKWIRSMTIMDRDAGGFWEDIGWSRSAETKLTTYIENRVVDGHLRGFALGGDHLIEKVEISLDGGVTWDMADLQRTADPAIWTIWTFPLRAKGRFDVVSRAADAGGSIQDPLDTIPFPDGSSAPDRRKMRII